MKNKIILATLVLAVTLFALVCAGNIVDAFKANHSHPVAGWTWDEGKSRS